MPSENYYNRENEQPQEEQRSSGNSANRQPMMDRAAPKMYDEARRGYDGLPPQHQKEAQRKLQNLQKSAPLLAKNLAKGNPGALAGLAGSLLSKIDLSRDWLFLLILAPAAFLKDIFDIVFASIGTATSWIPGLGQAGVAVGITVAFVGEILLLSLTVVVLALSGSSFKNRGMAKYFIGIGIAFFSEALPGISWLPLAFIEAILLYGFVLFDRAFEQPAAREKTDKNKNVPAHTAADGYYSDERMAA